MTILRKILLKPLIPNKFCCRLNLFENLIETALKKYEKLRKNVNKSVVMGQIRYIWKLKIFFGCADEIYLKI